MEFLLVPIFWLGFSAAVASYASNRGRSGIGWMIFSLLLSPLLGFLFVAASPNLQLEAEKREQEAQRRKELENSKTCPKCAENVKKAATVCRFCGYDFASEIVSIVPDSGVGSES